MTPEKLFWSIRLQGEGRRFPTFIHRWAESAEAAEEMGRLWWAAKRVGEVLILVTVKKEHR